jgi:hypothetical protein
MDTPARGGLASHLPAIRASGVAKISMSGNLDVQTSLKSPDMDIRIVPAPSCSPFLWWGRVPSSNEALVFQTDFGLKDGAVSAMKGVAFGWTAPCRSMT